MGSRDENARLTEQHMNQIFKIGIFAYLNSQWIGIAIPIIQTNQSGKWIAIFNNQEYDIQVKKTVNEFRISCIGLS